MKATTPKRVKVQSLGRGLGSVWQRTKDSRFEHIYVDPGTGRQVCKTLGATTKSAAIKEAAGRVERIDRREIVAPTRLTFDELAQDFFSSFASKVTTGERSGRSLRDYRLRYKAHIEPRLGRVQAQSISRAHALRLLDDLRASGAAPATISAVWRTFVRIVNHGRDRNLMNVNIRLGEGERVKVRNARSVRTLTPEEAARVIKHTPEAWRTLVETAALTGARVSELLGLQWQDIDLATGTVKITKQLARTGEITRPKTANGTR